MNASSEAAAGSSDSLPLDRVATMAASEDTQAGGRDVYLVYKESDSNILLVPEAHHTLHLAVPLPRTSEYRALLGGARCSLVLQPGSSV